MDKQMTGKKDRGFFANTIQLARPFTSILPEVRSPIKNLSINEKVVWTIMAILIYTIASQVPMFGIINTDSDDKTGWLKIMMAGNRGTLMDLGISPIISA